MQKRVTISFHNKILLAFVCFALLPALLVGILASQISRRNIMEMCREDYLREFQDSRTAVSNLLQDADGKILDIYMQDTLQYHLSHELTDVGTLAVYNSLRNICSDYTLNQAGISMVGVYGINGMTYLTNSALREQFGSLEKVEQYRRERGVDALNSWSFVSLDSHYPDQLTLINIKTIRKVDTLEFVGYLVTGLDRDLAHGAVSANHAAGNSVVVDETGLILHHPEPFPEVRKLPMEQILEPTKTGYAKNGSGVRELGGRKYLTNYSYLPTLKCYFVNFVPYEVLSEPARNIVELSAVVMVISFLVSIAVATMVVRSVMKPVDRLSGVMEAVERGDLRARFTANSGDEINRLGLSLNQMIQSLDLQFQQIQEVMQSKRESDRKLLQAQINPHLIYNSLNSFKNLVYEKDYDKLIRAIDQLSAFYRISLSSGNNLISLEEELRHVKAYVELQNLCPGKDIDLRIDVEEEALQNVTLKMTLQPIVENALVHGLAIYDQQGTIKIRGRRTGSNLILEVEDEGAGVEEPQVRHLNEIFDQGAGTSQEAYGLSNINSRLRYYFGRPCGLAIESEPLEYTKVTITLPQDTVGGWNEKSHHSG